jgi:hypothetical protein
VVACDVAAFPAFFELAGGEAEPSVDGMSFLGSAAQTPIVRPRTANKHPLTRITRVVM